jgi:hypothetical protein
MKTSSWSIGSYALSTYLRVCSFYSSVSTLFTTFAWSIDVALSTCWIIRIIVLLSVSYLFLFSSNNCCFNCSSFYSCSCLSPSSFFSLYCSYLLFFSLAVFRNSVSFSYFCTRSFYSFISFSFSKAYFSFT